MFVPRGLGLGDKSALSWGHIFAYMWHKFAYYVHKPLLPNKSTLESTLFYSNLYPSLDPCLVTQVTHVLTAWFVLYIPEPVLVFKKCLLIITIVTVKPARRHRSVIVNGESAVRYCL